MSSFHLVRLPSRSVSSNTTADSWVPVSSWRRAAGLSSARSTMEMRGEFGAALIVPAYQTCNDPMNPDTALAIPVENDPATGRADADGTYFLNSAGPTALTVADKKLIRFGWLVKLASGTNGGATVNGEIEVLY